MLCSCQSSGKEIERKKFLNGGNAEKIRQGVNERMTSEKGCIVFKNIIRICLTEYGLIYNHSGDYSRKVPPVPIPNTEVKLSYAESTCRDTDREDRASPLSIFLPIVR